MKQRSIRGRHRMTRTESRLRRGIRTTREGLKILASLKSVVQLVQEDDPAFPNKAERILQRDQRIREVIAAIQMALAQAEREIQ